MPFIDVVGEDEAEGELWKLYDHIQQTRGRVSNVLRIQSLHAKGLKAHLDLYLALLYGKGPLTRRQRETIAVVVSAANGCDYCVIHHGEGLNKYLKDDALLQQIKDDFEQADIPDEDKALCRYAVHLTKDPANDRKKAVETLRAAGFDDEQILWTTEVTAYFNFVNRMVHGLGVELEDDSDRDYVY